MNLECHVCTGNKIATSFHSLDDIQAHLFSNHLDGPLDVFQFVCQSCELKSAIEYRLLKHEEKCGRESRSEEDMEKIHYKLQMYEMLEESLKYNMAKHQISSVQKNSKKNGSAENAGASPSVIANESTDNLGNLRTVKAEVQDQVCSGTNTQFNVKTEPEDVDASEVEVLGTVEIRKRKASSKSAEHISHRSGGIAQQNVQSTGEISNLRLMEEAKKKRVSQDAVQNLSETHQSTSNAQSRTIDGTPLWNQNLLRSANVDPARIPGFNSASDQKMARLTSTIAILRNKSATGLRQTNGDKASVKISAPAKLTNKIHVSGPRLLPECENSKARQKQEFRTYFSHFGTIVNVTVSKKSKPSNVTFTNCESAAKCIQQRTHKISGQDFLVHRSKPSEGMRKKLRANPNMPGPSTENVSAANVQNDPPAESNLGNQMPQATASSSSQVQQSVTDSATISEECSQSRIRFRGYKELRNRTIALNPSASGL